MTDATLPQRPSAEPRQRARELGLVPGRFRPGRWNAITDVEGVQVGHSTIIRGAGPLKRGKGPVRTGVTAILCNEQNIFEQRIVGSGFVLNGAGEVSGLTQLQEWGLIETPIFLTNTMSVGAVSDAAVQWMCEAYPGIGNEHDVLIPLVGECDDSWLNDAAGRHVRAENVFEALRTASSGPVAEGSVGGGTGMICCDFKSGIGTASRKLAPPDGGFTVGVLVMNNFGHMRDLRVGGLPIGPLLEEHFRGAPRRKTTYGSIIAVVATDAPLSTHQLTRVAKRAALGIGRAGSIAAHGSGEIILAFSTANTVPRTTKKMIYRMKMLLDTRLDPVYEAAIEATEEAILNSLCMARELEGVNGNIAPALPLAFVKEQVDRWRAPARSRVVQGLLPLVEPARANPVAPTDLASAEEPDEPADPPTVAEALPSAVRGAEGMMLVPLDPAGADADPDADADPAADPASNPAPSQSRRQ
jgi:D-aminopeptidase